MTVGLKVKRGTKFDLGSTNLAQSILRGRGRPGAFADPGALGYPDRSNTGLVHAGLTPADLSVVPGATLPSGATWDSGAQTLRIEEDDVTLDLLDVHGSVAIDGNNCTFKRSRVFLQTGCGGAPAPLDTSPCGSFAIRLGAVENRINGTILQSLDIIAQDLDTSDDDRNDPDTRDVKLEFGVRNNGDFIVQADHLFMDGMADPWTGMGTIRNSYLISSLVMRGDHTETFINGGNGDPTVLDHCTILNPPTQTACVSLFDDFGPIGPVVLKNSILAGGGFVMYGGAKNDPANVLGPVRLEGNRFCRSAPGTTNDENGYYENGGTFGLFAEFNLATSIGGGNFWDDDLSFIDSPGADL
jgi:hypothetical protein